MIIFVLYESDGASVDSEMSPADATVTNQVPFKDDALRCLLTSLKYTQQYLMLPKLSDMLFNRATSVSMITICIL